MTPDLDRLRATLGSPDLSWIIERARGRIERGAPLSGTVTLLSPSPGQRSALDRLLGRTPSRGNSLSADLAAVAAVLRRAEICASLEEAVEALEGPVVDRKAQNLRLEETWRQLFRDATARLGGARAGLGCWLDDLEASGLLRRLARNDLERAGALLGSVLECLDRLPAPAVPLAELAAAVTGDSHALDAGEPLGTLLLRAIGLLFNVGLDEEMGPAEARRHAWAAAGVLLDELSAPVLVLNLRPAAGDPSLAARALELHAGEGEPYRLSVRQLLRSPPRFDASATPVVHVCENPTVVAAAASRLGSRSMPLVAIEGQPKTAGRLLLSRLAAAGIRLRYHGDFDWAGVRIANLVLSRHRAEPWRLGTADYLAAPGGRPLDGEPLAASWDADLSGAMVRAGRAVHEEQVLPELLGDLAPT
jgi:uncharacterized protein (TIGR02679 family)